MPLLNRVLSLQGSIWDSISILRNCTYLILITWVDCWCGLDVEPPGIAAQPVVVLRLVVVHHKGADVVVKGRRRLKAALLLMLGDIGQGKYGLHTEQV